MGVQEAIQMLNERQRQIVDHAGDHLLVMAPAGTGKTNVISLRIARLVAAGMDPETILCLTFTNKACQELQTRLVAILGALGQKVWVKTFHSFCYQLLKEEGASLGKVVANLMVIDEEDSKAVLKELMPGEALLWDKVYLYVQELKLFQLTLPGMSEETVAAKFHTSEKASKLYATLKNTDIGSYTLGYLSRYGLWIWREYEKFLQTNHFVDFNGLIIAAHELWSEEKILARWQQKFAMTIIDEVQDTSLVEYQLIEKLVASQKFSAFGDFNQTIYEWRDSNPSLIHGLIMEKFQPDCLELSLNYRSTKKLVKLGATYLDAAKQNDLINPQLSPKQIAAASEDAGLQPVFYEGTTKEEEMLFVIDHLKHHRQHELANTVILTRSNRQNMEVCNFLRMHNIPCYLVEQFSFFKRKEIKDSLSLPRYLLNPFDHLSLSRVLPTYFPYLKVEQMISPAYQQRYEQYHMRLSDLFCQQVEPFGLLTKEFASGRLVIFDVEATGLDVTEDEVVQIAAIEWVAGKWGRTFERFICPQKAVGDAVHVHGFSDEYLREVGADAKVVFTEFLSFIRGAVLVGHNIQYDLKIVSSHMKRVGLDFNHQDRFYDTLDITRRLYPELKNHQLATLSQFIGVSHQPTHNAMDDILATGEILVKSLPLLIKHTKERQNVMDYYRESLAPVLEELQKMKQAFNRMLPHEFMETLAVSQQENYQELLDFLKAASHKELRLNPDLPMWELWSRLIGQMSLSNSELDRLMKTENKLAIITVHQAKGLEFDHVIIPFLNQGMFPLDFAGINPEEECRLFYVAITRARKTLLLTRHIREYANSRKIKERSRFIEFLYGS